MKDFSAKRTYKKIKKRFCKILSRRRPIKSKTMNKTKLMFVLLASLILGACSSDDDSSNGGFSATTVSEAPVWQIDWSNDQARPNWTEPDGTLYDNWTILKVQIEDALQPYVSEGDMMALFVNGELRGLASPAVIVSTGEIDGKFLMKAYGNESGTETVNMTLQYYSQTMKHIFTLSDDISLNADVTTGFDEVFVPEFTLGSAKYPVTATIDVTATLARAGLTFARGNIVAAFVGDECRGVGDWSSNGDLIVFLRDKGEVVTLKYYDATAGKLYTIQDVVKLLIK